MTGRDVRPSRISVPRASTLTISRFSRLILSASGVWPVLVSAVQVRARVGRRRRRPACISDAAVPLGQARRQPSVRRPSVLHLASKYAGQADGGRNPPSRRHRPEAAPSRTAAGRSGRPHSLSGLGLTAGSWRAITVPCGVFGVASTALTCCVAVCVTIARPSPDPGIERTAVAG
jgi:hypothetical protein